MLFDISCGRGDYDHCRVIRNRQLSPLEEGIYSSKFKQKTSNPSKCPNKSFYQASIFWLSLIFRRVLAFLLFRVPNQSLFLHVFHKTLRFWVKLGGQIFDYNIKYIIFLLVLCLVSMYYSGQCRVIIDPTMHPNQYPTHYPIMDEDESLEK